MLVLADNIECSVWYHFTIFETPIKEIPLNFVVRLTTLKLRHFVSLCSENGVILALVILLQCTLLTDDDDHRQRQTTYYNYSRALHCYG